MAAEHSLVTSAPHFVLVELRGIENLEIDRVIQIVTVICNLVREVRDLRFKGRAAIFFQRRASLWSANRTDSSRGELAVFTSHAGSSRYFFWRIIKRLML